MRYQKQNTTTGTWIRGADLAGIKKAKIVSETNPQPSQWKNEDGSTKMQDVCKIRFEGKSDVFNISINKPTLNGLIDAFGEDSKEWMNKTLFVETEKIRVSGKVGVAIYLIPEGYEKIDNQDGYAEIRKSGEATSNDDIPVIEDEINVKDIPF